MLAEVTLGELVGLVDEKIAEGYETQKQEGRRRLRQVVTELAAAAQDDADDILAGRAWRLAEVSVAGVGGIATLEPQPLTIPTTRGVTLVRAPNGHGKTSLARAIGCGLRGRGDAPDEVTSQLWSADLLTDGEEGGAVDLTLVSGTDRLSITVTFARSAPPRVSAMLTDDDGTRPVMVGDGWRRALLGARAWYSYGALQNRLTQPKALQDYLEELLVLGPAWQEVRAEIATRGERAASAQRAVDGAAKSAAQKETELRARFADDDRGPVAPPVVQWPRGKDGVDPDVWLAETGLGETEVPGLVRVAADHERRVEELDTALTRADDVLAEAERALESESLRSALHHLEKLVANDGLDGGTCPLCGSTADWRVHAAELTRDMKGRDAAAREVHQAVSAVVMWTESDLVPLLTAGEPGGPMAEAAALRDAATAGHHPHSSAHQHARTMLDVMRGEDHSRWVERLRKRSDATAQWRGALATVAREFAGTLREHGQFAAEVGVWKKAEGTLDELQVELRQQRQDTVTERLQEALSRLLPDAEIELTSIRHQGGAKQQRGVDVELTIGGRKATLGMLSSGQRNALLLAPLLILDDVGVDAFAFLVVDDPVHALDDLRVDLLTRELARLAGDRQIVVMTHDARLEEHLRARVSDTTVVELDRDPRSRAVTWSPHAMPWTTLLDDALEVAATPRKEQWDHPEPVASVVAGLCRAAVDGALRQAVINRAVCRREDVDQALADLGDEQDTRRRIAHVVGLAGGPGVLTALDEGRRDHLRFWNQGSHGQLPEGVDLAATVAAASAACDELVSCEWSTS